MRLQTGPNPLVRRPRIALASCDTLPDWEVDDQALHTALRARDVALSVVSWSNPSIDWGAFEAVLLRTTWDYTTRRDDFVSWAEHVDRQTRLFNPAAVVRWNTHKRYLLELAATGAPTIPTQWIDRPLGSEELEALLEAAGWTRAFLKPAVGATAHHTLRFDRDEAGSSAAVAHLAAHLPHDGAMLLQPYLESVEAKGEISLVLFDGQPSHAVRKVPQPGDYRVQDDHGAHDEPLAISDELVEASQKMLEAARGSGALPSDPLLYARCDFIEDDEGHLLLTELELVEPSLFFRHDEAAAGRLADALLARL